MKEGVLYSHSLDLIAVPASNKVNHSSLLVSIYETFMFKSISIPV